MNRALKKRNVALIFLYDSNGRILLQHRGPTMRMPNQWAFFGGKIEKEETPLQAVIRETKEEIDYQLKEPELLVTNDFESENFHGTQYAFAEKYDGSPLILYEGDKMGWFTIAQAYELGISSIDFGLMKKVEKEFKRLGTL